MKFTSLVVVSLFVGLILAEGDDIALEKCTPETCDLLREVVEMRRTLKAVEIRLEENEIRLNESKNQILELRSTERTRVMFSAVIEPADRSIGPFNTDITVTFKTVRTNIGNAYSPFTGVFTAPVAGVYYFTIFYHAGGAHESGLRLYKNDENVLSTSDHQSSGDRADNGGNAVLLQLVQGDQVYVRLSANACVWGDAYHTTFSGFLVN